MTREATTRRYYGGEELASWACRRAVAKCAWFVTKCPQWVDRETMQSHAVAGAEKALRTYDPARGVPIESWVDDCVVFALREGLRAVDHLSRGRRRRVREHGIQEPRDLGPLSLSVTAEINGDIVTLQDIVPSDMDVEAEVEEHLRHEYLAGLVAALPSEQQAVVRMRFELKLNRAQMAAAMRLTVSAIATLEAKAMAAMRLAVAESTDCPFPEADGVDIDEAGRLLK